MDRRSIPVIRDEPGRPMASDGQARLDRALSLTRGRCLTRSRPLGTGRRSARPLGSPMYIHSCSRLGAASLGEKRPPFGHADSLDVASTVFPELAQVENVTTDFELHW